LICIKCGFNNPDGSNYCQGCNAVLPKMHQVSVAPPQKVNERYYQLKEAGEKVLSGEWTIAQYSEFLNNVAQILAQKAEEIREISENEIPPEAFADFEEELTVGFDGIAHYELGIVEMMLFCSSNDPVHIEKGLELVSAGNEKINEAMRINRDNRRKLEEMYIDTSTII